NLFINLSDKPYATLAAAKAAGAPAIAFGAFLNTIINFVIVAFVMFLIIRPFNRAKEASEGGEGPEDVKESVKDAMGEKGKGEREGSAGSEAAGGEADTGSAPE
ncbi:MAG TPA: MscL family protein, partial [Anaerolineae bacterium]